MENKIEFTSRELVELLDIRQQNIDKALKDTPSKLKKIEGASKPVKHYQLEDLPKRYQDKLKEKGFEPENSSSDTNISSANNMSKYLLAPPHKQKEAQLKCKLIELYKKRDNTSNQQKWLEDTLYKHIEFDEFGKVSIKQLNDWLRKYNEVSAKGGNIIEAFLDSRGAKKGVKALDSEQKQVAERYFLKATRPKITEIYRNMCHMFGDAMPSYDALNNYFKEWKRLKPVLSEFSKSPDSAKNKFLSAFGDESEKAKYVNHYWELDSTPADVICDDGKRYTVLAAIDLFSRRVVFHVAETSSSYSISQLLRKAILKLGIPENVVIDNGKDYTSNHFQSICTNLRINMNIVAPFSGECKPHVERMFGTLSSELFEQIPGYIGHNVAQRVELQARQSFAKKIISQRKWREEFRLKTDEEKKAFSDAWKIKKENLGLDIHVLLTATALQTWCDKWVDKLYEQRTNKGIKTSPIKKWQQSKSIVKGIPDERMLDLLLGESVTRKIGKKGIAFDGCVYIHVKLVEYIGHTVYIMAPDELGCILVYDENYKYICVAEDAAHMGQRRSVAKAARKKSKALMRQMDKIVQEALEIEDVTILDRIDAVEDIVQAKTNTVIKHTEAVDMLLNSSKTRELEDAERLEQSNRYDFKTKDEAGKPTKVLPSGRPAFTSYVERFVWDLENDKVDDTTRNLAKKYPDMWEMALKEAKVG